MSKSDLRKFQKNTIVGLSVFMVIVGLYVIAYFHISNLDKETTKIEDKFSMEFVFSGYTMLFIGIFSISRFFVKDERAKKMWVLAFIVLTLCVYIWYPLRYYDSEIDDVVGMIVTRICLQLTFVIFLDFDSIGKGIAD